MYSTAQQDAVVSQQIKHYWQTVVESNQVYLLVQYVSIILRFLYFTWVFSFSATLSFLYLVLYHIYVTAAVTS